MGLFHSKHTDNLKLLDNCKNNELSNSMRDRTQMVKTKLEKNYKNLVLSGGGVKGVAHCGALKYLHEIGVIAGINKIAATSAGSIIASLLAVGYTALEIEAEILKLNLRMVFS